MNYEQLAKEFMDDMFLKKPPFKPVLSLSQGEMGTMLYLVVEKDHSNAGEIASRVNLTSGRMASVLNSLEKKGYITKHKNEEDKRQVIVSTTKEGRTLINKHGKEVHSRIVNLLKFLGEKDALEFVRIQKRLNNDFDASKEYW